MTTDITELALSLKAAAHKAKQANELYIEGKITLSECVVETKDYLDYSDNPNNFLALVEALEKAQRYIEELREWNAGLAQESFERQQCIIDLQERVAEFEPIYAAAEKLVRFKGRYHGEQNYRALAALFGVNTPDLPPIDGESRTVTVKLPPRAPENLASCLDGYEKWLIATTFRDTWNACLDEVMRTGGAGIKWEAE